MSIGLKGNLDGSGAIQIGGSDAITISTGLNTTFAGTVAAGAITSTGAVAGTTGTLYPIVSGTAVASTSGTAIDFISIPSWVKRITFMLNEVSANGTSGYLFQIGSGSIATSGYLGTGIDLSAAGAAGGLSSTAGIPLRNFSAAYVLSGHVIFTLVSGNIWVASGLLKQATNSVQMTGGSVTLSGTLDRVRITTVNGTDTFDAGSINILYE